MSKSLGVRLSLCACLFGLAACGQTSNAHEADEPVAVASEALTASDCPAGYHIIQGTASADNLVGTAGNDCILGLGGNDVIHGGGGDDYIAGGSGDDTIYGEAGADQIFGEGGNDTIDGGDGNDVISGGAAVDTIHGGANDDRIHGDDGNDQLYGDDGDDIIDGDANADTIRGGNGDDVIYGDAANDIMYGEAGDDALIGGAGTNTADGGPGTDACSGTSCEKPQLSLSGCTQDSQCAAFTHCITDFGLCIGCVSDQDNDHVCDSHDGCPSDANKTAPGVCGCGVADTDSDGDGTPNCSDACPNDAAKIAPGACGCGVADTDSDGDGTPDCNDACPSDAAKVAPGACGCGVADTDSDGDGTPNCLDACPNDAGKVAPGVCGCGVSDADSDGDGIPNCNDRCPLGDDRIDSDSDGLADACDACPYDAANDADGDGVCGDADRCPAGDDRIDTDHDGVPDACDPCPADAHDDSDHDGSCDSVDTCPGGNDAADADGDGVCDLEDACAGADDQQDANNDGVADHCEILRPVSIAGVRSTLNESGDLNNDGRSDLISAGGFLDFLNQGGFEFMAVPTSNRCESGRRLDDLDGDGHREAFGFDAISDNTGYHQGYYLCYSDSSGGLQPTILLTSDIGGYVYAHDVTGDGRTDLLVTTATGMDVFQLLPGPARGVAHVQHIPADRNDFYVYDMKFADLDGDGKVEAILRVWDGELRIYRRDQNGDLQLDLLGPTQGLSLETGDIDGDGYIDFLTMSRGDYGPSGLLWYRGLPPSTPNPAPGSIGNQNYLFDAPVHFALPPGLVGSDNDIRGFAAADLAAGPGLEIVLQTDRALGVLGYRHARGLVALQAISNANVSSSDVSFSGVFGDFNSDGKLDAVQIVDSGARVLANVACRSGTLPDTDADGIPDACDGCAGVNSDSDHDGVCDGIDRCANGDDHLDADHDGVADACDACPNDRYGDSDGDGSCDSQDPCRAGDDSRDADGDGVCDASDVCPGQDDHLDADQNGMPDNCSPLTLQTFDFDGSGWALAAGDFDGDHIADLIQVTYTQWAIYRGLGDGHFELFDAPTPIYNSPAPLTPLLGDFDADGHLDAVLMISWNGLPIVGYGDGTGHLELGQMLETNATQFVVGDVTGDGRPDITAISGAGFGVFADGEQRNAFVPVAPGLSPQAAQVGLVSAVYGDFDGDGTGELIGVGSGLYHLAQRADGSLFVDALDATSSYDTYTQPAQVSAADLDADGRDELLVLYNSYDNTNTTRALKIYSYIRANELFGYYNSWGSAPLIGGFAFTMQQRSMVTLSQFAGQTLILDVAGDSRPELIVQSSGGPVVMSMTYWPSLMFTPLQTLPGYGLPIPADVDGDGQLELIAPAYNAIEVLRRATGN